MTTNYRMVTFKGELVEIAEKFNTWRTEMKEENKND